MRTTPDQIATMRSMLQNAEAGVVLHKKELADLLDDLEELRRVVEKVREYEQTIRGDAAEMSENRATSGAKMMAVRASRLSGYRSCIALFEDIIQPALTDTQEKP